MSRRTTYDRYNSSFQGRYRSGKHSAKARKITWAITLDEYVTIVNDAVCVYCDGDLDLKGCGLDRVRNDLGYELGNVVPCCGECNWIKKDNLSFKEMMLVASVLKGFRRSRRKVRQIKKK